MLTHHVVEATPALLHVGHVHDRIKGGICVPVHVVGDWVRGVHRGGGISVLILVRIMSAVAVCVLILVGGILFDV